MKAEKRTERLEIRVSPVFLEAVELLRRSGRSVADVIHEAIAHQIRTAYIPRMEEPHDLPARLEMADRINDTDTLKRRRQIEKIRNKKKPGD